MEMKILPEIFQQDYTVYTFKSGNCQNMSEHVACYYVKPSYMHEHVHSILKYTSPKGSTKD